MESRWRKILFTVHPATRHVFIFLMGLLAIMLDVAIWGDHEWGGTLELLLALACLLIGLTLAVGNVVRGGSKMIFVAECVWLALPVYLVAYGLWYFVAYLMGSRP